MFVKELMTREVITISPDACLKEVGDILKSKRISGIPVVEKDGTVVGIITLTDMLRILDRIYQWAELEKTVPELKPSEMFGEEKTHAKVKDIMTKNVVTLDEDKTIYDVMELMFSRKIHTIPIVNDGKLVGVVGKRDLVYACF